MSSDNSLARVGSIPEALQLARTLREDLEAEPAPALAPSLAKSRKPSGPPPGFFEHAIHPEDIGYTHPIFIQCFMPVRHHTGNEQRWQVDNGRGSLVIRAGELVKPGAVGIFKRCTVPAGSKARLLNAYITNYALKHRTRTIPLGESLRQGMHKIGIQIGGKNGKELQRELENLASAHIVLGTWDTLRAHQHQAQISDELSFWADSDDRQRTIWQSEMVLSDRYYEALRSRPMAPVYWPALIGLQHNPRAMDIHTYLVYRLRSPLTKPVTLLVDELHSLFGQDIDQPRMFWRRFKFSLEMAHKWYPTAMLELLPKNKGLVLRNSAALIPFKKSLPV